MRKREEITPAVDIIETRDEVRFGISPFEQIQLEVLLDIRDLLTKAVNPLYQIKDSGRIEIVDNNPSHHE